MSYFGSSPWADAGNYGQAMGQTLAQSMLGVPQQRYENMMQLKQMQAQQQQRQMMGLLAQQKQQELSQYRQGLLQQRGQASELANQWRMFQAQTATQREHDAANKPLVIPSGASVLMPQQNGGGVGTATNGALEQTPPNPQGLPTGNGQPAASSSFIPGYTMQQAPQRLATPITENQTLANTLKALDLFGKFSAGTNTPTAGQLWGQNVASNLVQNPMQYLQQMRGQQAAPSFQQPTNAPAMQQTNSQPNRRVFKYNPATGGIE